MHNNYYFLRQLSRELEARLRGTVVSECFSQSKDELIIRFETREEPFFTKAGLLPNFSCLSFPENFQRARKNSADLFDELIGRKLVSIRQFDNERSFAMVFTDDITLLFKMHGNVSNVILFKQSDPILLFKNSITTDASILLSTLDRTIDWSYEAFVSNEDKLSTLYVTFGKPVWQYLDDHGFYSASREEKWQAIQRVRALLETPTYYISRFKNGVALTLVPVGEIVKEHRDAILAVTDFYYTHSQASAFLHEKQTILSSLRSTLTNFENYIEKTFSRLAELEGDSNYKIWADLIMANLHVIPPRAEKITVSNFYHRDVPTEIKLKQDLSPQKNAEAFYRKSKNQHIELERLQHAIEQKEKEIAILKNKIDAIEAAYDLKSLRSAISAFGLSKQKEKQPEILPYHSFEFMGFKIWVGRNAQSNDVLTFRHSFKEDLWLHAKDVAGSHVLVKYQSGKPFPKGVIERAAELAAYNSKRKTESLCPVIVTPKKFVRKRKGDPAGAVVVEREEVIMVEPRK